MVGRKPKPTEMKRQAGNPGKRPLNEREPKPDLAGTRVPRGRLDAEGRRLWKILAEPLVRNGILTELDLPAFELLCEHFAITRGAAKGIRKYGQLVKDKNKDPRKNPLLQVHRDNSQLFRMYAAEFGLTPSSRVRIKVDTTVKEKTLAELLFEGIESE